MGETMVGDHMAFFNDSPGHLRILLDMITNHKESGLDVCGFQGVQNFRGPKGGGTVIEREGHYFFLRPDSIQGPFPHQDSLIEEKTEPDDAGDYYKYTQ